MGYSIGPKIGIDGENEFRSSIKRINETYKALEAETRAVTAAFDANGDKQGALEATSRQLEKQLTQQRKKLALLEDAVQKATAKYGEGSLEATRLNGALYDTKATISKLESELSDTDGKLKDMANGLEHVGDEADEAGNDVLGFSDILNANIVSDFIMDGLRELGDLVIDFAKGMPEAAAEVQAAESQFEQAFGDMETSARAALEAISEETNIATTRMQSSYTQMYAFAKAAGAESGEALDLASRALVVAADNAAYYDKSIEDATETLQSFLKGNYENDAALGVSCTETTRNAAANELYAKSFNELSEAQKQLTLLHMVEQANEATGALGQAARESQSWANTTGELAEAWRQLQAILGDPVIQAAIPIIQDITDAINALLEQSDWEKLDGSMDNFVNSMEDANTQFAESVASAESAAYAVQQYLNRLSELEAAGLNTAQSQYEYKRIIEEINALIPGLNLTINEQTGLLEQNKGTVQDDVAAWLEMQKVAALQQKLANQTKAYSNAQTSVMEARYQLNNAEAEGAAIEAELVAKQNELKAAMGKLTALQNEQGHSSYAAAYGARDLSAEIATQEQEVEKLARELEDLNGQLEGNADTQENLNNSITEGEKTIEQYGTEIEQTTRELEEYSKENKDAANSQDQVKDSAAQTQDALQALEEEYEAAKDAARDSLDSQMGLFDELSLKSEMSAQEIVQNWAKQKEALEGYTANMQKAIDMGLDEALVQQLSDGSTESMAILNELVNSTNTNVDQINAAFRELEAAKNVTADAMAGVATSVGTEMDKATSEAYSGGANVSDAVARGIIDNLGKVQSASVRLAGTIPKVYNQTIEIRSPSRVMRRAGNYTAEGAIVGIEEMIGEFENSMRTMAKAGENAFLQERLENASLYPSLVTVPTVTSQQTRSYSYGDISISIYQQPGEDMEELAQRVMEVMQAEVARKEAGVGG